MIFPLSFLGVKFSRLVWKKNAAASSVWNDDPQLYRRTQTTVDRRLFGELLGQPPSKALLCMQTFCVIYFLFGFGCFWEVAAVLV